MTTPKALLRALDARDGRVCAWHGVACGVDTLVPQHRQGGAGGRRNKHRLSNVLWLDSLTNGAVESDPALQSEAKRRGIKVSLFADPVTVPVVHAVHGRVFLNDDGTVSPCMEEVA